MAVLSKPNTVVLRAQLQRLTAFYAANRKLLSRTAWTVFVVALLQKFRGAVSSSSNTSRNRAAVLSSKTNAGNAGGSGKPDKPHKPRVEVKIIPKKILSMLFWD